ncbi:MAG: glutathione S-transferase family protein [Hyphomicrobiales bacterium]
MSKLHIVLGNKNYSSWSMRPWLAMSMAGIAFKETVIQLDTPETKAAIAAHSKAGRVPVLHHGKITVWESLAILEYLADTFPRKHWWPKPVAARAAARSIASEVHAGFAALRNACPMNLRRPRQAVAMPPAATADVARIEAMWRQCRTRFGKGGKFLFGKFCNADAMYAPVVTRFDTYAIPVCADTRAYMENVMATPAFKAWKEAALRENWVIKADEVD